VSAQPWREILREIKEASNKVAVLGLGKSGFETLRFFGREGISAIGVEGRSRQEYLASSKLASSLDQIPSETLFFSPDSDQVNQILSEVALVVTSPGIAPDHLWHKLALKKGLSIVQEVELALSMFSGPFVAVTGSNGKSTTTHLIGQLLKFSKIDVHCVGNIGVSPFELLPTGAIEQEAKKGVVVVELSSYQIEALHHFVPDVGVFLNLSENHLARHGSMQRYFEAKARLFYRMGKECTAILYDELDKQYPLASTLNSSLRLFGDKSAKSLEAYLNFDPRSKRDQIVIKSGDKLLEFDCSDFSLVGRHNRLNLAAALLAIDSLGLLNLDVAKHLDSLSGLAHRIESIERANSVWINDSKSTTIASSVAALKSVIEQYPEHKIVLLLGGILKGGSLLPLEMALKEHAHNIDQVLCFGQDHQILSEISSKSTTTRSFSSLRQALLELSSAPCDGKVVLFTPGGASFDEFTDFEERGNVFKSAVAELS